MTTLPRTTISPMRLAVARHLVAVVVHDAQLARGDQLDALPRLDRARSRGDERRVLGPRLADGDERRGLGQAVDLRDRPAELALDALDRRGRRRRAGRQHAHAARHPRLAAPSARWRARSARSAPRTAA